jgi:large subunit ribosomal protein MRP49
MHRNAPELLMNGEPLAAAAPLVEWQAVEFACLPPPGVGLELLVGDVPLEAFLRPGDAAWRWRWNPQNAVGSFQLRLRAGAHEQRHTVRVSPRKLSLDHYEQLLDALERDAAGLAAALLGGGAGAALRREPRALSAAEEFAAFVSAQLSPIERAFARVAGQPAAALVARRGAVPLSQANSLDAAALAEITRGPFDAAPPEVAPALQRALAPEGGLLPQALPERRSAETHNTYENQLARDLLDGLLARARRVAALAARELRRLERNAALVGASPQVARLREVRATCAEAQRRLRRLRELPFLAEVGPLAAQRGASHLLRHHPAYRQIYAAWRALRHSPAVALESPLFHLPLQELPALYEAWCAVTAAAALLALPGWQQERPGASPCLQPSPDGFAFRLPDDEPLLALRRGETTLALRYQARYRPRRRADAPDTLVSLDRHTRVPDLAVELRRADAPPAVLVLDAKYRLDASGGVPEDALADAYAYRGSIGLASGEPAARAALLLYPGLGRPELYANGVGAMPLLPGADEALREWLGEQLDIPL